MPASNTSRLRTGGSYMHHADSFALIRGGHLDLCVLGAFQVAENGDIANWSTSDNESAPAVGGAMDLAAGARRIWVMMDHTTKSGESRLVRRCTYPLTAVGVVKRVYTNLAVLDVTDDGFAVREMVPGMTLDELQKVTDAPLRMATCRNLPTPRAKQKVGRLISYSAATAAALSSLSANNIKGGCHDCASSFRVERRRFIGRDGSAGIQ